MTSNPQTTKTKSGKREMACAVGLTNLAFWAGGALAGDATFIGVGDTMWPGTIVLLAAAFGMESLSTQFRR